MSSQNSVATERRNIECVEIYVPKKLEHLSELFRFLRERMSAKRSASVMAIDGFSLYEVDGAFHGDRIYQERTLVIRLLLAGVAQDEASLEEQITTLGRDLAATVAMEEEELWITHCPQWMHVFRPERRVK